VADQVLGTRTQTPPRSPDARRLRWLSRPHGRGLLHGPRKQLHGPRKRGAGTVFGVSFAALLSLLLVRNPGVYTLHVAERGDSAANSILIEQAKHFHLLIGNYSRIGAAHPGPALLYVQAFGEWLGHDVLGVLPSPYSGQWLAIMVLNAALVAATLTVLWEWIRSWRALLASAAVALAFVAAHDHLLSSTWMPFVYFAPFLLFLTTAASVAAGRTTHLWLVVLSGGLLVHGHAEFLLLFVPAIGAAVLAACWHGRWRWRPPAPPSRRHWLAATAVAAVFLLPMVLNLVLHWPGEFGRYLHYGTSRPGGHGLGAELRYMLWFWCPQPLAAAALAVALVACATLLARRQHDGELRRFLTAGVAVAGWATALFAGYVVRGVDDLGEVYIGFFFWAVPLLLLMLIVAGASTLVEAARAPLAPRAATAATAAALTAAVVFAAVSPAIRNDPEQLREGPAVISALARYGAGRPAVVSLDHAAWPVLTALLVDAERAGQRMCVADSSWRFMVTSQFICSREEAADGFAVHLAPRPDAAGTIVVSFGGAEFPTSVGAD
jgi:hypothetical protein